MKISVRRYEITDEEAVKRLNERLAAAGIDHRVYPEDPTNRAIEDPDAQPVHDSLFVAVEGDEVRGGTWLREQDFWADGSVHRIGWMKYPVSESLINARYAGVPASMMLQLMRRQPRLLAAGMGGHDAPIARLLAGIGWVPSTVPFFFRIIRPFRVLRGLRYARQRTALRVAMDVAAFSGAGGLGNIILNATARGPSRGVSWSIEPRFASWADVVWRDSREHYRSVAVRDGRALDHTYPETTPNLDRVRVRRAGDDIGWAAVQMLPQNEENTRYFGRLRVGIVTDCLSAPSDARDVLWAAQQHLRESGADLVVAYASHTAWIEAAKGLRFFPGPSTFALYRSKAAVKTLGEAEQSCHLTRTDGHGHAA